MDWSTIENEGDLTEVSMTVVEKALEEEFSDYIVDNMAEYSMTWVRENGLFFSEEPVPSGGIEDFMEYLMENNVDMDDPEAVKKAFGAFTVQ